VDDSHLVVQQRERGGLREILFARRDVARIHRVDLPQEALRPRASRLYNVLYQGVLKVYHDAHRIID